MSRPLSTVLCIFAGLILARPDAALAQAEDPLADVADEGGAPTDSAEESSDSAEESAEEEPVREEEAAPAQDASDRAILAAEPKPAETSGSTSTSLSTTTASATKADAADEKAEKGASKADKERCAQLLAQGQTALAQAEGCGGGDQPIWAGSTVSFSQTTAPAYRTLPDNDNGFYALGLTLAPRLTLTERWALNGSANLAYELTEADDPQGRRVQSTDTTISATGNFGSIGGFTFTGGPRIVAPTSKNSWANEMYVGTGASMNIVKPFDVLQGLAFIAGGSYAHTFSGRLTPKIRGDRDNTCTTRDGTEVPCSSGNARVTQDSIRALGAMSLNFTAQLNLQLSYLYGWNYAKPFADGADELTIAGDNVVTADSNVIKDTRERRFGSLGLSVSYQPVTWLIASLQGSTSVCYTSAFGGQSPFGGCSGASKTSDFWLRNPIANKFSTVALQFTIPVDALYDAVRSKENEQRQAARKKRREQL